MPGIVLVLADAVMDTGKLKAQLQGYYFSISQPYSLIYS